MPTRAFNTAGPCDAARHYLLPAMDRLPALRGVIDQGGYFVLHAPRQTGKSTAVIDLSRALTAEGRCAALLVSVEAGAAYAHIPGEMDRAVLTWLQLAAEAELPPALRPPPMPPGTPVGAALAAWSRACPRPVVVFFDEVDALQDDALVAFLRQLRAGYPARPSAFPHSVCLVGLRDVRDYTVDGERLGTASPFPIQVESFRLRDFLPEEVNALLQQHTDDTGQPFTPEARAQVWAWGRGQPWLTNALARAAVAACPAPAPVDGAQIGAAAEELIRRQDTHLDSLAHRLAEPRVRQVLAPMLSGDFPPSAWPLDELRYVQDLGLVREEAGALEVANPIYRQIIARTLVEGTRLGMGRMDPVWLGPDGRLCPDRLLAAFVAFWRAHAEPLFASAAYPEIAPHLVLMAWLDRVANGGGRVHREYAVGLGRLDLLLEHGPVRLAIEVKTWRERRPDPAAEGLAQLDRYLDGLGLDTGWLLIFDARRHRARPDRATAAPARTPAGRTVTLLRG
jgi:hypothetical protein